MADSIVGEPNQVETAVAPKDADHSFSGIVFDVEAKGSTEVIVDAVHVGGMLGATPIIHRWLLGLAGDDGSSSGSVMASLVASMVGGAFGAVVSHPFDTVKTKMQTQSGFTNSGALASARQILSSEGAVGFYRGCLPPMWGSAVYRSAQFAVYDLLYAEAENYPASLEHVPGTDMQWRVLGAGAVGATARTVLESPIEYAKVKGQTNQKWRFNEVYRGAGLQWARTGPMMTLYFCLFDACKRNGYASTPAGQFFSSGGCALIGFWVVWPFENLKNQAQAGKNWLAHARATGLLGLYRGIV